MTERRVAYLQGRIAALEAAIAKLEFEDHALDERKVELNISYRNLWQDRLWSAILHRQARIPVLIQHAQRELEQFCADLDRYHTKH